MKAPLSGFVLHIEIVVRSRVPKSVRGSIGAKDSNHGSPETVRFALLIVLTFLFGFN